MEITININAPELAQALNNIAHVIAITVSGMDKGLEAEPQQPVQQQTIPNAVPVNNTSANNVPVTNVPVQQAPIQNVSVQQPPSQPQYNNQPQIQQAPVQQSVPTQTQTYTMDQLAIAATQLMDSGKRTELIGLLGQFGVQALTALPKEQYGAFATALRGMGAKI